MKSLYGLKQVEPGISKLPTIIKGRGRLLWEFTPAPGTIEIIPKSIWSPTILWALPQALQSPSLVIQHVYVYDLVIMHAQAVQKRELKQPRMILRKKVADLGPYGHRLRGIANKSPYLCISKNQYSNEDLAQEVSHAWMQTHVYTHGIRIAVLCFWSIS